MMFLPTPSRSSVTKRNTHRTKTFLFRWISLHRERLFFNCLPSSLMSFQSTLPVRGATQCHICKTARALNFNPRSPCGERQRICTKQTTPPWHIRIKPQVYRNHMWLTTLSYHGFSGFESPYSGANLPELYGRFLFALQNQHTFRCVSRFGSKVFNLCSIVFSQIIKAQIILLHIYDM
jgi:hypothetical protein